MTKDFSTLAGMGGHELNSHRHRQAKAASNTTTEWVPSKFRVLILEAALSLAWGRLPSSLWIPRTPTSPFGCTICSVLSYAPPVRDDIDDSLTDDGRILKSSPDWRPRHHHDALSVGHGASN
jgi:hypothetical protein